MKSFTQYLQESKKTWKFKIKTVHGLTDEQSDRIDRHLVKYNSAGLSASKKTMLQSAPVDFPTYKGYEVFSYEFETAIPVSSHQLRNEIQTMLALPDGSFKVKGEHEIDEPAEQKDVKSVLEDGEYSEAEKVNVDDYYGEKYKTKFVQELLKLRKNKEKDNE